MPLAESAASGAGATLPGVALTTLPGVQPWRTPAAPSAATTRLGVGDSSLASNPAPLPLIARLGASAELVAAAGPSESANTGACSSSPSSWVTTTRVNAPKVSRKATHAELES